MEKEILQLIDCGMIEYRKALEMQMDLWQDRVDGKIPNTALLVEHPSVITLGVRKTENKLIVDEDEIINSGIEVERIGRGGGTTAHNPGQIVVYPIIMLKSVGLNVTKYVRSLEGIGIELLRKLGVESERRKGYPGLWIGEKKIVSIGVQIKKWVTLHGMAINIQNDLGIFNNIVPCGLKDVEMTSVFKETGEKWDMGEVKGMLGQLCAGQWQ